MSEEPRYYQHMSEDFDGDPTNLDDVVEWAFNAGVAWARWNEANR